MVTRCICFDVSFEVLKTIAEKNRCSTLEDLQKHLACGAQCELCVPYIRRMLQTGETTFEPIWT